MAVSIAQPSCGRQARACRLDTSGSRRLWAQIVALGWHPCLRYPPHFTFQPEGQTQRVPVRSLIPGPGGLWVGTGRAFRDPPLDGTRGPFGRVLHAYGQKQPWVLLTDTPVAETEPTLYATRNWIEQGFRGLKTVGWKWHKTRRRDPTRVGRHWLVLAIATLLAVAYGTRREDAEARHREPGRLRRPPAELTAAQQAALPPRRHSLLQPGVALLRGYLWAGPTDPDSSTDPRLENTLVKAPVGDAVIRLSPAGAANKPSVERPQGRSEPPQGP